MYTITDQLYCNPKHDINDTRRNIAQIGECRGHIRKYNTIMINITAK